MSPLARALDGAIALYQRAFDGRPSPCRYIPSCSTYARDAVAVHGGLRGGWLAVRRLVRCAPWGGWGFDPVPEPRIDACCEPTGSSPNERPLRRTA